MIRKKEYRTRRRCYEQLDKRSSVRCSRKEERKKREDELKIPLRECGSS